MMKTFLAGVSVLACVLSASATDKAQLNKQIHTLTTKLVALQQQPEKRIPAETLRKAKGIILLDRTKAGFIFAYQGGGGVAMVRDPKTGKWSPPAFLSASEASLGFQIGGEQNFFVTLLMTTNAAQMLTQPSFNMGGEARGTAGDTSSGVEGDVASTDQPVVIYSDRRGLYGGAAVKGGALSPNSDANEVYYGDYFSMKDILFDHKVKPTEQADKLVEEIDKYSKKTED